MRISIVNDEEKGEKRLYLNGIFRASWDISVDDMKVIVAYALDECFEMGKQDMQKEIRKVLGL